jgi:hypothetical protein
MSENLVRDAKAAVEMMLVLGREDIIYAKTADENAK